MISNRVFKVAILGILPLLVLTGTNNKLYAANNTRDTNSNPVYIQDNFKDANLSDAGRQVDYIRKFSPYSESHATLKGGVSQLISIVGKSQLIRFDEPAKRVSIANPNLADLVMLSKQELLINGKAGGVTSLIVWGEKGDPVFFDLNVKTDTTAFLEALKEIAPNEDIDIKFTPNTAPAQGQGQGQAAASTNAVFSGNLSSTIIRDQIKELAGAYGFNFVNLAESKSPQVMLEVKIVEASRSLTRNLRTDFQSSTALDPGNMKFFVNPFRNSNLSTIGNTIQGATVPQLAINHIRLPILNGTSSINLQEQKGKVKVLAEPKLIAINKQEASFEAGQEIPVPMGIDPTTGQINYGYKNVGVNLKFTPEILDKSNKVLLKLSPEVSSIDSTVTVTQTNGIVIYGMRTRKANTSVELGDGETLVIAGLLQRNDTVTSNQIPFLGDIPIIGPLFSSKEWQKGETELMIFVTPRILKSDNLVNGV